MVRVKDRPSGAAPSAVWSSQLGDGPGGWVGWGPLQVRPCKLDRRIHAAHAPSQPTLPTMDGFLRTAGKIKKEQEQEQKQNPMLQAFVPTNGRHLPKQNQGQSPLRRNGIRPRSLRQIAGNCRRRGGSGCGGVRGMDAAAKPPWTGLRRPPPPDPPRHPTECPLLLWLWLWPRRVQGAALPETLPSQQASATAVRGRPSHASSNPVAASRPPATGIAA